MLQHQSLSQCQIDKWYRIIFWFIITPVFCSKVTSSKTETKPKDIVQKLGWWSLWLQIYSDHFPPWKKKDKLLNLFHQLSSWLSGEIKKRRWILDILRRLPCLRSWKIRIFFPHHCISLESGFQAFRCSLVKWVLRWRQERDSDSQRETARLSPTEMYSSSWVCVFQGMYKKKSGTDWALGGASAAQHTAITEDEVQSSDKYLGSGSPWILAATRLAGKSKDVKIRGRMNIIRQTRGGCVEPRAAAWFRSTVRSLRYE